MFTVKGYKANGDLHLYEADDCQVMSAAKNANGNRTQQIRMTGAKCPESINVSVESSHYVQAIIENAAGQTTEIFRAPSQTRRRR